MRMPFADWRLTIGACSVALALAACAGGPKPKAPQAPPAPPAQPAETAPVVPSTASPFDAILPRPAVVERQQTTGFTFTPATVVLFAGADPAIRLMANQLGQWVRRATGLTPASSPAGSYRALDTIELRTNASRTELGGEGYDLVIGPRLISLEAATPAGVFYGIQTLRQLLPYSSEYEALLFERPRPATLPAVHIRDTPRYPWRGATRCSTSPATSFPSTR
jgi:hexosaminidase